MSYFVYENKENCCGCSACMNICPKKAIVMKSDEEGFLYPDIDGQICVECGLCKKVCDFQKEHIKTENDVPTYAVKAQDTVRKESTSGGMYKILSDFVLKKNGTVYGAAYNEDMCVVHTRAQNAQERDLQRGSKYVQSDLGGAFALVKKDLLDGKYVLFSGTSCQVAGLANFLSNVDTEKLLLVDLLCHGVPSPRVFSEYINFVQTKRNKKVVCYLSRAKDKKFKFNERIEFADGSREIKTMLSEIYNNVFYSNNALRQSCYNCKYTGLPRYSDITIADFWGIEDICPDFYDKNGISLVILNSEKGMSVFENVKNNLEVNKQNFQNATLKNHNLVTPTKKPAEREKFWQDIETKGYEFIFKTYGGYNFVRAVKRFIKKLIKYQK